MEKFIKENWFRVSIIIVAIVACGSISFYFLKILPDRQHLEDSISYQDKCSTQSRIAYKDLTSLDLSGDPTVNGISYNSESHYNSKLNKCFILLYIDSIDSDGVRISDQKLFDSYGLNIIASFTEVTNSLKGIDNVEDCSINNKKLCSTVDEFTSLIKPYMTD